MEKVHLIAIGGSAMHNLALALHEAGYRVTGSDDEINEPSKSRLLKAGLLPEAIGWFPEKITSDIGAIILGMHARANNPELLAAKAMGLKIYSYPEYIYQATQKMTRIVIGGSHGKTTITSMILHVFKQCQVNTAFLVGAQLEGFTTMVNLDPTAKFAVIEGDEYLASPIDRRPKFHLYHPHIAVISGIAWDHINVFPTFENYIDQFRIFIQLIEKGGRVIYSEDDSTLKQLCEESPHPAIDYIPYGVPSHQIENGVTYLNTASGTVPLQIFGSHNLLNLNAAWQVCKAVGITNAQFLQAISSFKGAAKRLELVFANSFFNFYKDFAHSPSKLKATIEAVKTQFPYRRVVACMELHTFSSLNESFLKTYEGAMHAADEAMVYYNPHTIAHKQLAPISINQVKEAFGREDLMVYTVSEEVISRLEQIKWKNSVLLMMSSGNFDGVDFNQLAGRLVMD